MKSFRFTRLLLALCLLIPILALPFCADRYASIKLAVFLFGSTILLFGLLRQRELLHILPRSIKLFLIFFLVTQLFQTLRQSNLGTAFLGEHGQSESFLVQAGFIIFFLSSFIFFDADKNFTKLRQVLIISVYILFIFGIYQYYCKDPFNHEIVTRISSLMGDPNSLGFFLLLALPMLYYEYLTSGSWSYLALGSSFLGIITLFLTYSRASWLGFLVINLIIILNWIRQKPKKILILGSIIGLALFTGQILTKLQPYSHSDYNLPARLNSVTQGNDSGRALLWSTAWKIFVTKPLIGDGLGSFQDNFHLFQTKATVTHWGVARELRQVHNELLHYLATQGLLGFTAYLGLILIIIIHAKPWQLKNSKQNKKSTLLAAVIAYLIVMQFAYPLLHYSFLFWIYLGILLQLEFPIQKNQSTLPPLTFTKKIFVSLGLIIATALSLQIIAADYYFQLSYLKSQQHKYYAAATKNYLAIKIAPWNYFYRYRYGLTLIRCGRNRKYTEPEKSAQYFKAAEAVFLDLKKTNPKRYQIPLMLGKVAENKKNLTDAARYYQEALQLFPNHYQLCFYLARVELSRGNTHAAKAAFATGLKINPEYMLKMAKTAQLAERLL